MTAPQPSSESAFHEFEQTGWERAAEHYSDAFGALTTQTAPALLRAVRAGRGTRLLDVASGPGFVAAAAAHSGAAVIGLDFASAMVHGGRRRSAAVRGRGLRRGGDEFRHAPPGAAGRGDRRSAPRAAARWTLRVHR